MQLLSLTDAAVLSNFGSSEAASELEHSKGLVRRHEESVSLGAAGDIVHLHPPHKSHAAAAAHRPPPRHVLVAADHEATSKKSSESIEELFCLFDFPLGVADSEDCTSPAEGETRINETEVCIEAARRSGAHEISDDFELQPQDPRKLTTPRGCYKADCTHTGEGTCYYYNPAENAPTVSGQPVPVCQRARYKNGTINQDDPPSTSCPAGYSVVVDEAACIAAAGCLGACVGNTSRVNFGHRDFDDREYNKYPLGCFMDEETGCYLYNPPEDQERSESGQAPHSPKGTPLCNVSAVVTW